MKRFFNGLIFGIFVFAFAASAGAASLTLSAGATLGSPLPGLIPTGAPNAFLGLTGILGPMATVSGYYGSTVNFSVAGAGSITIDFFGGEAGFPDQFQYNSGGGFVTPAGFDHSGVPTVVIAPSAATPLATFTTGLTGSGILPFRYLVNGIAGGPTGGPVNGLNPLNTPGLPPNFFAACAPLVETGPSPQSCSTMWLFLDDNGANNDDDHDDYVVRIRVSDGPSLLPEPSSFIMLGVSLSALALLPRKRSR